MLRYIAACALTLVLALGIDAAPARAQRVPPGTYQQSCSRIRVRGNTLTAQCSAPNGRRIVSSVALRCRGDIGNVNGYLRCNGNRRHRR